MQKFRIKLCIAVLLMLLTAGLAACSGEQGSTNEDMNQPPVNQSNDDTTDTNDTPGTTQAPDAAAPDDTTTNATQTPAPTQQPTTDQPHQHTLAELGATIEAAGEFWNRWWASHHTFNWEHIDDSRRNWQPWDENITPAHHPLSRGFAIILPSSGFTSLNDIGVYLSQFYTQSWINRGEFSESNVSMEISDGNNTYIYGVNAFEEYDGYLFTFIQVEWTARPNWRTATHTLREQDGNRAVVDTVVTTYISGYSGIMPTVEYRFILIDGKIDSGHGQVVWADTDTGADTSQANDLRGHSATLGNMFIFIHREEDIITEGIIERFHTVNYFGFSSDSAQQGDTIFIETSESIYDVSLVRFSNDWDDNTEEVIYILTDSINIADALIPGEGILIYGYTSMGTLPWSGISFYDTSREPRQRHFFAINHDNSDSHNWFMIWDITNQMRFE